MSGPRLKFCYLDEAGIDLNPRIGYTQIRCGEQPLVLTPGKNVKPYVAGALERTHRQCRAQLERVKNSTLFVALLAEFAQRYRRSRVLYLVPDNRGIHKLHDHVTRNHQHCTIELLMSAVEIFLRCAQPFPGNRVSILLQGG